MREARITWKGALHHVMNRGLNKQQIFSENKMKKKYIELMAEKSEKYNIRIFAYCIMNNHFHFALENTSGNLSNFMKSLNGNYGQYYRKFTNSKGYVFEDRFKSTLIQDESYLTTLIMYIFQNPERSSYVSNPFEYRWSSICSYFNSKRDPFLSKEMVEEFFLSRTNFINAVSDKKIKKLEEQMIRRSRFFGDKFLFSENNGICNEAGLNFLVGFTLAESVKNTITEFEIFHSIQLDEIDLKSHKGKKLRRLFLVDIKEKGALEYSEICKMKLFSEFDVNSLRVLYHRAKNEI